MVKATFAVAVAGLIVSAMTLTIVLAVGLKSMESKDAILASPTGKLMAKLFPNMFA